MSWHDRPRPSNESIRFVSQQELMNRIIRAKAKIALAGRVTVTLRTEEGVFEITPELAKKLLAHK